MLCSRTSTLASALKVTSPYGSLLLLLASLLAGQDAPKKPDDVVSLATQDALTKTIAERIRQEYAAFKRADAAAFGALLTDDYRAVLANGALHFYKPTAQELASVSIDQYIASQIQARPIGQEGALATYIVQLIGQGGGTPLKLAVGEVWVSQGGVWKCEYYHATVTP